jgi:gamma-glutamyltranspeptidase/glutathione hydrolase
LNSSFNWDFIYPSKRMPILAENVVATSQPLAAQAGLQMLLKGGNAVDAAIASAIALTVVEPTMNGIGSDSFAILWNGKRVVGLNASGRSPAAWTHEFFSRYKTMPIVGWDSVTIPGTVSAWVELSKRYGQLSFRELFRPAIKYAEEGFLVSPITAEVWRYASKMYKKRKFPSFYDTFMPNNKSPDPGTLFKIPQQAKTLRIIAETEGDAFYNGEIAKKIVEYSNKTGGSITLEDLEEHQVDWVEPITLNYHGITLHEIPPNGQGLASLIMLGILKNFDLNSFELDSPKSLHLQIEAMKLAFSDAYQYVSDCSNLEFDPSYLLRAEYLNKRAKLIDENKAKIFETGIHKHGDTVYLTTADKEGMMVSYIQSNFLGFGSGIVIPNTGISMQNRGNGFTLRKDHPNQVGPKKRPYHTIIPAFITKNGEPLMSFGCMGGSMQPQGHAQLIIRIFDYKQNPQTAIDAPRWRVLQGLKVSLEKGFDDQVFKDLNQKGHQVSIGHYYEFGGAQLIYKLENGYLGASEWRKDGQVIGF